MQTKVFEHVKSKVPIEVTDLLQKNSSQAFTITVEPEKREVEDQELVDAIEYSKKVGGEMLTAKEFLEKI
ncbi:MAG: hypothetical protein HQK84_02925 [Nitrospinae bacterium]|nr:hypothetical protein [Nitrospinota bacterium]